MTDPEPAPVEAAVGATASAVADRTEPRFDFVAGSLALDLVNTRTVHDGEAVDRLRAPGALLDWLVQASALAPEAASALRRSPPEARLLLTEALALRDLVAGLADGLTAGRPPPPLAVHAINRVLGAVSTRRLLVAAADGVHLEARTSAAGVLGALAPVAQAAARLLTDADPSRLRRCSSPACGLRFLDASRNGRRRWCSMERCGNRAKAARHYRRTRGAAGAPASSP